MAFSLRITRTLMLQLSVAPQMIFLRQKEKDRKLPLGVFFLSLFILCFFLFFGLVWFFLDFFACFLVYVLNLFFLWLLMIVVVVFCLSSL